MCLVAAITNLLRAVLLQEGQSRVTVGGMRGMAAYTGSGIGVQRLPTRQESVEVPVEVLRSRHIGVALQAIGVADGQGQRGRLLVRVRDKRRQITRSECHGANPTAETGARVTVNTAGGPGRGVFG